MIFGNNENREAQLMVLLAKSGASFFVLSGSFWFVIRLRGCQFRGFFVTLKGFAVNKAPLPCTSRFLLGVLNCSIQSVSSTADVFPTRDVSDETQASPHQKNMA